MANDLTKNPWVVDTAAVLSTDIVLLQKLTYHPAADDNDLLVVDGTGSIIWAIRGAGSANLYDSTYILSEDFGGSGKAVRGVTVTTIDGGSLHILIR